MLYSYEPELHPGVTYKLKEPKATLKIFSTGSVTVTGLYLLELFYCIVENYSLWFLISHFLFCTLLQHKMILEI